MTYLDAPWRSEYFSQKRDVCVFCEIASDKNGEHDEQRGVLWRGKECFAVMNLYPYTPGHFMVIPFKHTDAIEELSDSAWLEMSTVVRFGVNMLKQHLSAEGVNIGMNLGAAAGAGIAEHVHYHLVPRWSRDTNFITTISHTRVNGVQFYPLYEKLKEAFAKGMQNV